MRDDLLVSIAGEEVADADIDPILARHEPGDRVTVTLRRGGETLEREVTLAGGGDLRWTVEAVERPSDRQIRMRERWLGSSVDR